jgi:hypothetical protein
MKKVKKCPICGEGKKKRSCKLQQDELICIDCCLEKQNYYCNGCPFYQDEILRFKCPSCGKTSIDDQPSEITQLMETKIHDLDNLEGNKFDDGFAFSGEIYTTSLEFPFEGKANTPLWFSYDPDKTIFGQQLIQAEIVGIEDFNYNNAKAEMFIHQTSDCANIINIFPEVELPESLYDIESLFPVGSLTMHTSGNFVTISSMIQDGGNRLLIAGDEIDPRIILYAEGFFNHWQAYAGNIRIKRSLLQQIQNQANVEK